MTDRFQQLERQLQSANKQIADLQTKYLAMLEDLKLIREQLNRVQYKPAEAPSRGYESVFDRWPGTAR
jgi:predicted  nucleic acid-binding Zn-ribbon protein